MPNVRKTITLTEQQNAWIEARIRQGGFTSLSKYVQALVERDQARYRESQAERDALEALRRDFDARLASLSGPEGAERMRRATEQLLRLGGRIRAGESDEEA